METMNVKYISKPEKVFEAVEKAKVAISLAEKIAESARNIDTMQKDLTILIDEIKSVDDVLHSADEMKACLTLK